MNYLETYKRAVALGWIPTRRSYVDEDAGGNGFVEEVWEFRSRLGKVLAESQEEFESLDGLLRYYHQLINEQFELVFGQQQNVKVCPRCETANYDVLGFGDYHCAFCGTKYSTKKKDHSILDKLDIK